MPSARTLSGESLANAIYAITDKLEEQFVEEFILQARKLSRGKSLQQLLDQIEGGYFTSIASIPSALSLIKINTSKLDAIVRKAIGSSARITNQKVGLNLSFNVRNPKIIETARNISVELSTNLSKTSQQIIDKVIANAMEGLVTRREAIKIIESRVGLLPAHSDAVDRYYDTLIQSGSTKAMAKKLADKYADRLLKYRANTIARTEIARATGIGQTEFWRQAMDEGVFSADTKRVWTTGYDELVCDICGPMNKIEVGIFEQWLTPNGFVDYPSAIHPNCRCSQGIALSASQKRMFVGKTDGEQFEHYVLSKFNPYHDELGRFTFASGGRRVSAMPKGKVKSKTAKEPKIIGELKARRGIPDFAIEGIIAEARNHDSAQSFVMAYTVQFQRGFYTHITSSDKFKINSEQKSYAGVQGFTTEPTIFVSATPEQWKSVFAEEYTQAEDPSFTRKKKQAKIKEKTKNLAILSFPDAPKETYSRQSEAGGGMGHQIVVRNEGLKKIKVHAVMPYKQGLAYYRRIQDKIDDVMMDGDFVSGGRQEEKLKDIWEYANKDKVSKFNPYHDELGRFTSGPAGKRISARPKMTRRQLGLKGKVRSIIRYSSEERKEAVEKLALEGSDKLLMPRSENGFAQVMPKDMADKRYGSTVAEIQKSIKKLGVKSVVVTKSFAGKDDEEKAMAVRQMQATAQALEEAKAMGVSNKKLEILFTTRLTQADGLYDGWSGGNERDGKITIDLLSTSRVKAIAKKVQADDAPRVINAPTVAETTYASDYLFIESEEDFIGKYAYSVAIHEIGHHYTYKDAETPNVRRKFSLPTPSKYGRTDKYEMLAESFSAWWLLGGSKGKVGTFYKRWLPFVQVVLNANDNRGIGVPEALLKSMAKTETVLDVLKLSQTSPLIVYLSDGASLPDDIEKFNPYHDELGRFTSGPGNSKKVGPGGLLFHITDKKNRKSIEQNGFKGTAENPLFMAEQPHPFSTEDTDVYVIDTSGVKLFPDTKRLIDRSRKSYFSETPIPLGKFRRLIGEELKVVYETHNSFKWNPDVISKFNPYHDELGRFTFASGGRKSLPTQATLFGGSPTIDGKNMQHNGYDALPKPTTDLEVARKTGAPIEWLMPNSMHPKLAKFYSEMVLYYTENVKLEETDTRFNGLLRELEILGFNKYDAQIVFEGINNRARLHGKTRRRNIYAGQDHKDIKDNYEKTISSDAGFDFEDLDSTADRLVLGGKSNDELVTVNLDEDVLLQVLPDGRYKTQFETKTSGGMLSNKTRASQEVSSFSLHPSLIPSLRPVYGQVHSDGFDMEVSERAEMYGRIVLVLDPKSVNGRTTWNEGDSLNSSVTHSNLDSPSYHGLSNFSENNDYFQDGGYIEAQIHGGVKKQNIKYIVLPVEYRDFADPDFSGLSMEDRLEQIGVKSSMIIYADEAESRDLSKSFRGAVKFIPTNAKLVATSKSSKLYSVGLVDGVNGKEHLGYVQRSNGKIFKVNVDDIYSRGYWNVLL